MPYSTQQVIVFLAFLPVLVAFFTGVFRFRRLDQSQRYVLLLVCISLLTEIISRVLWIQHKPNLFLLPFYLMLEFGVTAWLYKHELSYPVTNRLIPVAILVFSCFCLAIYFAAKTARFSPVQMFVESVLILTLVLLYFHKVLREMAIVHLEKTPMFWVSAGLFIYFAGNILIFIFSNYLLSYSKQLNLQTWAIHAIFNVVLYTFYSIGLWVGPKN